MAYGKADSKTPGIGARVKSNLYSRPSQVTVDHKPLCKQHPKAAMVRTAVTGRIAAMARTDGRAYQPGAADPGDYGSQQAPPIHQHTTVEKLKWEIEDTEIHVYRTKEVTETITLLSRHTN